MKRIALASLTAALASISVGCGPDTCLVDLSVLDNTDGIARLEVAATCNKGEDVNDGLVVTLNSEPECGECASNGTCNICPKTGVTDGGGKLESLVTNDGSEQGLVISVFARSDDGDDSVSFVLGIVPTGSPTVQAVTTPTPTINGRKRTRTALAMTPSVTPAPGTPTGTPGPSGTATVTPTGGTVTPTAATVTPTPVATATSPLPVPTL